MKVLFRTTVSKTKHSAQHLIAERDGARLLPEPTQLSIADMGDGSFFLFREDSEGVSIADTWHQSVDDAIETAEFEYVITGWLAQ